MSIAGGGRLNCVFTTVFWGDWHRDMFLDVNLPTLLAAGNLPALTREVSCEYLIYTTSKDAVRMISNSAYQRLRSLMPVEIRLFKPSKTKHPVDLHQDIWGVATKRAQSRGAFILLMPPDVCWANGSFTQLRNALVAGKRAIFMTYPRVVSETIVPAMQEHFPRGTDGAMNIPPRDMMALAITHIHPLMAAYNRSASHFPIHPEMVLWPIADDGFLLRLLARELFCFEPGGYPLNSQALLARIPSVDEICVFCDAHEFLGLSLTPLWKDMEWYLAPNRLDPLFVGRWWVIYDSPANDYISALNLRFGCGNGDDRAWPRAERSADALMSHLRSAREFYRVLQTLVQMKHTRAAAFLASALRTQGLARRWPHRGPFVVLAPTDEAFERAGFERLPGDGMSAAQTRKMIEAHVAEIPTSGVITEDQTVTTLTGRTLRLSKTALAEHCRDNVVLSVPTIEPI
jgi:Fasciclin domain